MPVCAGRGGGEPEEGPRGWGVGFELCDDMRDVPGDLALVSVPVSAESAGGVRLSSETERGTMRALSRTVIATQEDGQAGVSLGHHSRHDVDLNEADQHSQGGGAEPEKSGAGVRGDPVGDRLPRRRGRGEAPGQHHSGS